MVSAFTSRFGFKYPITLVIYSTICMGSLPKHVVSIFKYLVFISKYMVLLSKLRVSIFKWMVPISKWMWLYPNVWFLFQNLLFLYPNDWFLYPNIWFLHPNIWFLYKIHVLCIQISNCKSIYIIIPKYRVYHFYIQIYGFLPNYKVFISKYVVSIFY